MPPHCPVSTAQSTHLLLLDISNIQHRYFISRPTVMLSLFILPLVCVHLYNLAFCINRIHLPICGAEARGNGSTQHAPLRDHSRSPQLLSIRRIFSNYISIQLPPHTRTVCTLILIHTHIQYNTSLRGLNRLLVAFYSTDSV